MPGNTTPNNATPEQMVVIKGNPKTFSISSIRLEETSMVWEVRFFGSPTWYHYRQKDVAFLAKPQRFDPDSFHVFHGGKRLDNISSLLRFSDDAGTFWRVTFQNGKASEYRDSEIQMDGSCLNDPKARKVFEFLKDVASDNDLGTEEGPGILSSIYDKISFLSTRLAIAPYLDPDQWRIRSEAGTPLVFPFGCNKSQMQAAENAFTHPVSIIQGPPGTGKTQTILNILANTIVRKQTAMVVSANNSAIDNVREKLDALGLGFIVAPLGNHQNKVAFLRSQCKLPVFDQTWLLPDPRQALFECEAMQNKLKEIFESQTKLAEEESKLEDTKLEWNHFQRENPGEETQPATASLPSSAYLDALGRCQRILDGKGILKYFQWAWFRVSSRVRLKVTLPFSPSQARHGMEVFQRRFYVATIQEHTETIARLQQYLAQVDAPKTMRRFNDLSIAILRDCIARRYQGKEDDVFTEEDMWKYPDKVLQRYPIILSTTFSARTSLSFHTVYDYLVMDESSQISIETGALALTAAKNAVIVGDGQQLPAVIQDAHKRTLLDIFNRSALPDTYNPTKSFLQSACEVFKDAPQVLLREHYRCQPAIIDFCNQKFYGGQLLVMSENLHLHDAMKVIVNGSDHPVWNHVNQREIDIIKDALRELNGDVGIITPYRNQAEAIHSQIPGVEANTVHAFQGREKDIIILSLTDKAVNEFADNPNLLNVAVSRAKSHFYLLISIDQHSLHGNVADLIGYIHYHNFEVTRSKIHSIFDLLSSANTEQRRIFLQHHRHISYYDSENLTFAMIEEILTESRFAMLRVVCHYPLCQLITKANPLSEEERKYAMNPATHLDFLIYNHITKMPVLAIETDGITYHHQGTRQHQRDVMKNHVLEVSGLPILRLSTTESDEKVRAIQALEQAMNRPALPLSPSRGKTHPMDT